MRRATLAFLAVLAAVLVQVTILDNLRLPGGSPPDLVLIVVVTLALSSGPAEGAAIGFGAGLCYDVAPPASHLIGQGALTFCLVGYLAGRASAALERASWLPLVGTAVGVAAGEALYALVGATFGDPDITLRAAQRVVPVSCAYDVVFSPFVLYALARLGGFWGGVPAAIPALFSGPRAVPVLSGLSSFSGAVRDTHSGRVPRLKAGAGGSARQRPAGTPGVTARHPRPGRLRGGVAGSAAGGSAGRAAPLRKSAPNLKLGAARKAGLLGAPKATGKAVARAALGGGLTGGSVPRLRARAFTSGPSAMSAARAPRPATAKFKPSGRSITGRYRGDGTLRARAGGTLGASAAGRVTSGARVPGARVPSRKTFSKGALGGPRPAFRVDSAVKFRPRASKGGLKSARWSGAGAAPKFRGNRQGRLRRWLSRPGARRGRWRIGGSRMGGLS